MLRQKSNAEIEAKLSGVYGQDALCQRTVDAEATCFPSGRTSVEDHDRPRRLSNDSHSAAVFGYLNRNPEALCPDIANGLFIAKTTVLRFRMKWA
jgi:hypothetical protein